MSRQLYILICCFSVRLDMDVTQIHAREKQQKSRDVFACKILNIDAQNRIYFASFACCLHLGSRGILLIVVGIGNGDPSLKPAQGCFHFHLPLIHLAGMNPIISPSAIGKLFGLVWFGFMAYHCSLFNAKSIFIHINSFISTNSV